MTLWSFRLDRLHRRSDALFKQADEQLIFAFEIEVDGSVSDAARRAMSEIRARSKPTCEKTSLAGDDQMALVGAAAHIE